MRKDNIMREYLIFILIAAGLLFVSSLIGDAFLLPIALPLVIAVFSYRNEMRHSVVFVIMTSIVSLAVSGIAWLFIMTIYGLVGVLTGRYIKLARRHEKAVMSIFISAMVGVVVLLFAMQGLLSDISIGEFVRKQIQEVQLPAQMLDQLKAANPGIEVEVGNLEDGIKQMTIDMMPVVIAVVVFFNCLIVYIATLAALRLMRYKTLPLLKLSRLRLPGNPMAGTTCIIIIGLLLSWIVPRMGDTIIMNTLYVVVLIFSVQGVAVLSFFLERTKFNRLVRGILFIAGLFLLQVYGLGIVGWLDVGFKIRYKVSGKDLK